MNSWVSFLTSVGFSTTYSCPPIRRASDQKPPRFRDPGHSEASAPYSANLSAAWDMVVVEHLESLPWGYQLWGGRWEGEVGI